MNDAGEFVPKVPRLKLSQGYVILMSIDDSQKHISFMSYYLN